MTDDMETELAAYFSAEQEREAAPNLGFPESFGDWDMNPPRSGGGGGGDG